MTSLITLLKENDAGKSFQDWVLAQPDQSLKAIWATCPRGDWLLWLHEEAGTPWETLEPVVYRAVNRAFEYAEIGFGPVKPENVGEAAKAALATWAAYWAARKAGTAVAAAEAAEAAYWAAGAIYCAAVAAAGAAAAAEHLLCADDCRELLELPKI